MKAGRKPNGIPCLGSPVQEGPRHTLKLKVFLLNLGDIKDAGWRLSAGLVLPQGLCESLCPHSSWTPVRAAGEADAKHLPMGRTLAAAPRSPSPHSGKPGRAVKLILKGEGPIRESYQAPLWVQRRQQVVPTPACTG